jgi:hypothetical protein
MVSAALDGVFLRTATWLSNNKIYTTTPSSRITWWDASLGAVQDIGTVEIATGQYDGEVFGLKGRRKSCEDRGIERNVIPKYEAAAQGRDNGHQAFKG